MGIQTDHQVGSRNNKGGHLTYKVHIGKIQSSLEKKWGLTRLTQNYKVQNGALFKLSSHYALCCNILRLCQPMKEVSW